MSRRGRAIGFAALALTCAGGSASIASTYRQSVDDRLGDLASVVILSRSLHDGEVLRGRLMRSALTSRRVPVRFLPPDAIADPAQVLGRKAATAIPAGSYLLGSHLRSPDPRPPRSPALGKDLNPVDVVVSGAGALAAPAVSATGAKVDVVVAGEPVTGGQARVRVAAAGVRLVAIEPASSAESTSAGGDSWVATLALNREQALELIEAENFAREIRLIPSS